MRHRRVQRLEHCGLLLRRPPARRPHSRRTRFPAAPRRSAARRSAKMPPCTMPKQARPGCSPNAAFDRFAQRIDSARDFSISDLLAGKAGHSSSTIWMSEPSRRWISIARSGREKCSAAVDMRLEAHALFGDLAQLRQRHHLEAAGIGQDRPLPVHEFVQAAQPRDALRAGPQHQVIGVAENDVGAGLAHGLRQHRLHRRRRADRHEGGRADVAARRCDHAGARRAVRRVDGQREMLMGAGIAGRRRHRNRSDSFSRSPRHRRPS